MDCPQVKALWDILGRTEKQVRVRFDVASSSTLGEVLAVKPAVVHLVCHADYDPHKLRSLREAGLSDEPAFFLGPQPLVESALRLPPEACLARATAVECRNPA